jgi:hypothetical protein
MYHSNTLENMFENNFDKMFGIINKTYVECKMFLNLAVPDLCCRAESRERAWRREWRRPTKIRLCCSKFRQ